MVCGERGEVLRATDQQAAGPATRSERSAPMDGLASDAPRRCAVLGSPVGHSLSPALHRAAYASLGLTGWTYDAHQVDEVTLSGFVANLDSSWRGLSLTMPLKRAAIPLCDTVSPLAREVSAVNTMVFSEEGRAGSNTDAPGVASALRERRVDTVESAVLLGVGATAGSALVGLAELGVRRVTAYARDPAKAGPLAKIAQGRGIEFVSADWGQIEQLPRSDVLVSTVPADVVEPLASRTARLVGVIFDVLYDPWPTPLAVAASASGRILVSGFDLLVHQAALQVEAMTGRSPAPLGAMRDAGETALAARHAAQ